MTASARARRSSQEAQVFRPRNAAGQAIGPDRYPVGRHDHVGPQSDARGVLVPGGDLLVRGFRAVANQGPHVGILSPPVDRGTPYPGSVQRLVDRNPVVSPAELLDGLVPPPRFAGVRFENYLPAPDQPTQAAAVAGLRAFAARLNQRQAKRKLMRKGQSSGGPRGDLPRRRLRRRQDTSARVPVPRNRRSGRVRHVRGVHEPRGLRRICHRGRALVAPAVGLHRRVRTRRSGRHRVDVHAVGPIG